MLHATAMVVLYTYQVDDKFVSIRFCLLINTRLAYNIRYACFLSWDYNSRVAIVYCSSMFATNTSVITEISLLYYPDLHERVVTVNLKLSF